MSHWDIRSFWRNRRAGARRIRHTARGRAAGLAASAGRARTGSELPAWRLEALEGRVLLSGDHPSYNEVFGPTGATPTVIDVSSGTGAESGRIDFNLDDDMFQFTTTSDDFITIQVDTLNDVVSNLDSAVRVFDTSGVQLWSGSSNALSPTRVTDGWTGFFAPAGTYYVQVLSDLPSGTRATGSYTVRVAVETTVVDVTTGSGSAEGAVLRPTGDQMFRVDVETRDFVRMLADTLATNFGGTPTQLNSKIAVYAPDGTLLGVETGNGVLTGSVTVTPTDAWIGFIADPGTYYVRVLSDRANATFGTGAFTVYADVRTEEIVPSAAAGPNQGVGQSAGTLTRLGEDRVYRVEMPNIAAFESLVTVVGLANAADLDTHLDIYDAAGNPIVSDSTSGNATNAFAVVPGGPGSVIYVRIRSDEIGNPAFRPSTGNYTVRVDGAATQTPLDPVTRVHSSFQQISNTAPPLFVFETLSSGITVMAAFGGGPPLLADPAMTLYDSSGTVLGFNDDLFGLNPQLDLQLVAGERYFILVDGFDNVAGGGVTLNIENLEFVQDPGTGFGVDDHANRGDWKNATPIQWLAPPDLQPGTIGTFGATLPLGYPSGPITDHSTVVLGYSRGRIYANGDTDVFQITPQIDMWGQFAGQLELDLEGQPVIPNRWEPGILPATRLQILVRGNIDGTLTPTLNVYRSNVLRADPQAGPIATSNTVLAALPMTPWSQAGWLAGFLDPAAFPPQLSFVLGDPIQFTSGVPNLGGPNTIAAWGGEPLFLEVGGTGTGTYEVLIVADAMPDESDPISSPVFRDEQISFINEWYGREPGEEGFNPGAVRELSFGTSGGGDVVFRGGANGLFDLSGGVERLFFYGDVAAPIPGPPPLTAGTANVYGPASPFEAVPPFGGATVLRETALNSISRIDDKDTYFIRATATGTTEVRINTTNLTNAFSERIANGLNRTTDPQTGMPAGDADFSEFLVPEDRATYDSLLDASLRIYNADFEQIAYNVESGVVRGESQLQSMGTLGNFIFHRRDPRVVFDVKEGEVYYIVVESAQRYIDGSAQSIAERTFATSDGTASGDLNNQHIDWRFATGTYELLVNSMPRSPLGPAGPTQLAQGDDHIDFLNPLFAGQAAFDAVAQQATMLLIRPNGTIDANTFTAAGGSRYAGTITNRGNTLDTDMFSFIASVTGTMVINVSRPAGSTLVPSYGVFDAQGSTLANGTASSLGTISGTFSVQQGLRYYIGIAGGGGSQGRYTLELTGPAPADDHANVGNFQNATPLNILSFIGGGTATGNLEHPGDTDVFTFEAFTTQDVTVRVVSTSGVNPVVTIYEVQEDLLGLPILRRIAVATEATDYQTTFSISRDRISTISSNRLDQYFLVVSGFNPAIDSGTYRVEFEFVPTDDHANEEQLASPATRDLASLLLADTTTGQGDRTGDIEFFYDTDLFVYIAPAGGPAIFSVSPTGTSGLQPRLSLYDVNGVLVETSDPFVTTPVSLQANVLRGQAYYLVVGPSTFLFNPDGSPIDPADPRLTGEYRLTVTGPAVDDHANMGEFDRATVITLEPSTGNGAVGSTTPGAPGNPEINPLIDTDLFRFSPRGNGELTVTLTSLAGSLLRPSLTLFRQDGPGQYTEIATESRTTPGTVSITLANASTNAVYFALVQDVFNSRSGEYRLEVDGQAGGAGQIDPSAVNFSQPDGVIVLNERTGNGGIAASIDVVNDRDLFTFTALGSGPIFVQVITADGSTLNASVTVLRAANENPSSVVGFDASGIPGVTASVVVGGAGSSFVVNEGQQFWVIVDGIGTSVGGYRVQIDGTPAAFDTQGDIDFRYRIYHPEGFANSNISEFVAIANPGTVAANYRVVLYYQTGEVREVFRSNVNNGVRSIAPGARAGAQLSQQGVGARFNVRPGVGYAVVIESDQPLAATLSHYDRGVTTGEALTRETSASWFFPRVERDPGAVANFITLYNPNNFSLNVTLTAFTTTGQQIVIERRGANALPANRRGGFAIDGLDQLPIGTFAVRIDTSPRNPEFNDQFVGIVAALTHYNEAQEHGFGVIGDPTGGGLAGAINEISRGNGVTSQVAIFNPGTSATTVTFRGTYTSASLPDFQRTFQVGAGSVLLLSGQQLGLTNNQTAGVRFISNTPVSILSHQVQRGDSDAAMAATQVGTIAYFGDAFLTKAGAGSVYFETLSFYNPAPSAINVSVRLLFTNGTSQVLTVGVPSNSFSALRLDQSTALLNNPNRTGTFSIVTTSSSPFAVTFTHYDLSFGGGWTTTGAAFGLYNPISAILA